MPKGPAPIPPSGRIILVEVDGNCSFENVPKLYHAGADVFVVGSSSVFHKDYTVKSAAEKLYASMRE